MCWRHAGSRCYYWYPYSQFQGCVAFDLASLQPHPAESKITFIDGDEGILLHRGFPIDQLATDSNYLEVCPVCWMVKNRTYQEQYDEFKTTVTRHTMIHETEHPSVPHRRDSSMAVCGNTGALAAFYLTRWMLTSLVIMKLPRSACCQCRPWQRCVTSIPLGQPLFTAQRSLLRR